MASRTANGKAGERIVLVDETQADRPTIEAYELITRKLRVSRVPLFFRALAGEKALLPCWQALRPAVRLRAFEEGADELRARAARLAVELGCPLIETQLEWAGYDVDEIDEIRGQVNIFHYQDAKILLVVAVLCEALSGTAGGGKETPRGLQRVPRGVPHEMDIIELVPEDSNGNVGRVFRSIRSHLGLGIVADDFRALARWPKYLNIAWDDARKRDSEPRARAALVDLWAQAEAAVASLPVTVSVSAAQLTAAGADPARVRALADRFRRTMPGLVLDLAQFKVQLDGAEDALDSPFPVRWKYISPDDYMQVGLDEPVKLRAGDPVGLEED
jgi:Halocarboxylic acid dehydrogenase DehI